MSIRELQERVLASCLALSENKLVVLTWGNVSELDPKRGLIAIKASGTSYKGMTTDDIIVVDLQGNIVAGNKKPSVDLSVHLKIYQSFPGVKGVAHTHSTYATAWAQSARALPCFGTTHADYFKTEIPCTREFTDTEIMEDYQNSNAVVIIDAFKALNPIQTPGVLMRSHGVFTWGSDCIDAVNNAVIVEEIAKMAVLQSIVTPGGAKPISSVLHDKHYNVHFGKDAYYGQ